MTTTGISGQTVNRGKTLRPTEVHAADLVANSPMGLFECDSKGCVRFANPALLELCGRSAGNILGAHWMTLLPAHDRARLTTSWENFLAQPGHWEAELQFEHPDGELVDALVMVSPIHNEGPVTRFACSAKNITQRKRNERALRESEQRYRTVIDSLAEGILVIDAMGIIIATNDSAPEILGLTRDQIIGRSTFDPEWRSVYEDGSPFPPERYPVADTLRTGRDCSGVVMGITRPDGERVWISINTRGVRETGETTPYAVVASISDITSQKKADEALRHLISTQRAILDSTGDGLLVVDLHGKIVSYNRQFSEMWRLPAEVLGARDDQMALRFVLNQVAHPEAFLSKVQELYSTPESESFDIIEFKDGRVLERLSRPQRLGGQAVGRVWSFRDVTEQRRAGEERLQIERKLQETQKLESLGVLAGGIAHDFNNLLTGILGHAALAKMVQEPGSRAAGHLASVERAALRAADLCKQMLAYAGKGRFDIKHLNLSSVVSETTELLQLSISKKAELRFDLAPSLPAVEADATQLRQVIMNLVMNASDAIGDQPGIIRISTGLMQADRTFLDQAYLAPDLPEGYYTYLEVSDTGCGMSRETQAKIFEPFFTTKFAGRGLGLAAVLGIVRGHNGALKVTSEPGRGTTFRVLLPAAGGAMESTATPVSKGVEWKGRGRVLVVDDEDSVREIASGMLEMLGFETSSATDGKDALEKVRAQPDAYDLLLLDLTMPNLDGAQTLREVRRIRPDLPVVLMSGFSEQEATTRLNGQGPSAFLQKPFSPEDLSKQLRAIAPN